MSDLFVQGAANTGTTSAAVTLTGVVAGNAIVVFGFTGGSAAPATHTVSDAQGSYTQQGSAVTDSLNTTWGAVYTLLNANAGSHTVTVTMDSGLGVYLMAVEVGTSAGASAFSGVNGSNQIAPGTGANALTSGSVPVTAAATLLGFSVDVSSTLLADAPNVGTSFTSRVRAVDSGLGASILETGAFAANSPATATAPTGGDHFITFGVAILNASGGGAGAASLLGKSSMTRFMPLLGL